MLRRPAILWALLAAFLIIVGIWPAAIAPVTFAAAGTAAVIGAIPSPVFLLAGAIAWLKYRPAPTPASAT